MTCTQYSLKTSQQPCPHPECWTRGEMLYLPEVQPVSYADPLPIIATFPVKAFKRERVRVPDMTEVWAWRPA